MTIVFRTRAMQILEHRLDEPLEVYLRRRYVDEGLSTTQLAEALGVNHGTVSRWLAHFRIPARPAGVPRTDR